MEKNNIRVLEERVFQVKSPTLRFYCPLCSSKRAFSTTFRLSKINFFQIIILTIALTWLTVFGLQYFGKDPIVTYYVFGYFFIVWSTFEFAIRVVFRKEVPCPYCGFDASWYKQDVRIARRLVKEFWDKQNAGQEQHSQENLDQENLDTEGDSDEVAELDFSGTLNNGYDSRAEISGARMP